MAKRKNFYYVLVLTEVGPVFVTNIPNRDWSEWNKLEKPMEFGTKTYADEVAWGLRLNGFQAFSTTLGFELGGQPYRYDLGEFAWVWNKDKKEEK